jgi:Cu(I)/Ag(I) efflux system periplasmic protein CusF
VKTNVLLAVAAAALVAATTAHAQSAGGMDHGSMGKEEMMKHAGEMADGEVRKVDKDAGKLTIKHGPIPSMDMPPMTMVYRVKEPAMLEQVKAGDKIRFDAQKIGGAYTVTKIEPAK